MPENIELKYHKRKIHRHSALVLLLLLFLIVNTAALFIGALFYNEFCVSNTRAGLERFRTLQVELDKGTKIKHWQEVSITSRLGYPLRGTYLPNPIPSPNTIIFVHGITANRLQGLWYADLYLDAGFNVLIYDARAHGDSGGSSVTWGFYEKYDLDQWVAWLEQKNPTGLIGVHGLSMGGATALLHSELNEASHRVKFYVADSAYADLEALLTEQIEATMPSAYPIMVTAFLKYSSVAAYLQSGFRYAEVSPVQSVAHATTPILYLHGEADRLVPVSMSTQLYDATKGYRELHTFPGVGHGMAIFENKAAYKSIVQAFIQKVTAQDYK